MPEITALSAELRAQAGKGPARATRRMGRVPGIIYGGGEAPVLISLEPRELSRALAKRGFFATLVDVSVEGATHRTLPREVQLHPATDAPLHVDFMRVAGNSRVTVQVPVAFVNQEMSIGLRRGGILNIVRHAIELNCPVDAIPDHLTVDLNGLDIGDSVHISAVTLPEGCRPTITERDFTIASIAASSAVREEAATAAAAPPPTAAPAEPAPAPAAPAA
ncbi:MAG TPA: 50S ribosomal protein L25/general stress protein Ctc [Stellaceae bacterium]|jgi:large subunit ribosomal protein L25